MNINQPGSAPTTIVRIADVTGANANVQSTYKSKIVAPNIVNGVNTLMQTMINEANVKYIFRYDFTLGEDITIPNDCVLEFDGGSISGSHTITGQNTTIPDTFGKILNSIELTGTFNCILRPEWFGAVGDGVTDDTSALRLAIYNSHILCRALVLGNKKYLVSDYLNYHNELLSSIRLNIHSEYNVVDGNNYIPSDYGAAIFATSAVELFKNATITGCISNIKLCGSQNRILDNNNIFRDCTLNEFIFENNIVSNWGAFLADSSLQGCSKIKNNRFLTVYYFHRFIENGGGITDSVISDNYINGGAEHKDNCCFEFNNYNGSYIRNNFIDYYRTIYSPKSKSTQVAGHIDSANNHYQVFLYFYIKEAGCNIISFVLSSVGDAFNWNDPSSLSYLANTPKIVEAGDNNVGTITIEPYIFRILEPLSINITNAILEINISGVIFTYGSCNMYELSKFKFHCNYARKAFTLPTIETGSQKNSPIYNAGTYRFKKVDTNFVFTADSLPSYTNGWCQVIPGFKFLVSGILYLADIVFDEDNNRYDAVWTKCSI